MIRTLYNPEVEKRGIEKGKIEDARNFLKLGVNEDIVAQRVGLPIEEVRKIKRLIIH